MMLVASSRQHSATQPTLKSRGGPQATFRTRSRRAFNAVDTNVASYDRKDPFAAFNALRKLIAILPSRIGGCQLRLTPEEQKLSMHLLAIVEPFIGLSPSRRTLTRQPTEVLDQIVGHVDSKRDLLALALSCKRMHDIVFPRHYEYRVVRCKVSNISVWSHLSIHRNLAQNVRRLEVLDERSTESALIPSDILTTDTELESSDDELAMHDKQGRLFGIALSKLSSLNEFVWSCNHSLISLQSIWPTLLRCSTLKSVEINDNLVFGQVDDDDDSIKSKRILPQLSSVAVRSIKKGYGQSKSPSLTRVTEMLHHCPNLQALDISYSSARNGFASPRGDDLFLCGRWSGLRVLTLTNLACSMEGLGAVSTFLFAHPHIESLHLDLGRVAHLHLPPNTLPRLRELRCNKDIAMAILNCQTESVRPLESLKGVRLAGQVWDAPFLDALKLGGSTIKRLDLSAYTEFEDIRRLAECVPKLSWLDVGKKSNSNVNMNVTVSNVVDWAELLTQLPELTTFHGVRFFYEVTDAAAASAATNPNTAYTNMSLSDRSRVRKNDEVSSVLAWKCPKLRRLDHWDENSGKVIVLLKDGEKVRWEIRRVKT